MLIPLLGLLGFACFGCRQKPAGPLTVITINAKGTGRVFQGIGGVSAGASSRLLIDYPEPYRSQVLDYLFKPDYGASLQHLKVEIGGDVNSTDGSEPSIAHTRRELSHPNFNRGYEWWLMEQAKERNPDIILDSLAWGAPGWIGNGKFYSRDMANYVVQFLKGAQEAHGLTLSYTGVWNETKYDSRYVKLLKRAILANHLPTKLVCCDLTQGEDPWSPIDDISKDPKFKKAVDVVGVHYPREKGQVMVPEAAKQIGKPLWSSEDGPWRGDWKGAEFLAKVFNENYIEGRLTKTEIWSPVTSYYNILPIPGSGLMYANTPWSGHYEVQPAIWATAHTTQFAKPGWQYIDSACGYLKGKGSYVTLVSPSESSKDYSVIIETIDATQSQQAEFHLTGSLSPGTVHVWRTNARRMFEHIADLTPHDGIFRIPLDPQSIYSLTTTEGQRKGNATPPQAQPFPFPYAENFETTPLGQSPKYFADQDGAFEVANCQGRTGRCLQQAVNRHPIWWIPRPDPYTLFGSSKWTDYQASADARFEGPGEITLLGRIDSANYMVNKEARKARWPSSYVLRVFNDGRWELDNATYTAPPNALAKGKVHFRPRAWHHLSLSFQGTDIQASVDGTVVARVNDATHRAGMVGIGTAWNQAEFDNIEVR
ncbi:MAG: DUF1080 domain-containing protein [Acidobacteria bacterium]|nr:DUF1080 domain-containing protein [Acidobacteriota bacterium]